MGEFVESTQEYQVARHLDGIGAYGIERLNGGNTRSDPILTDYSLEMGAYFSGQASIGPSAPQSPKRQPTARPSTIKLVCDTTEFPALQPNRIRKNKPHKTAWQSGDSVHSVTSGKSDKSAESRESDGQSNQQSEHSGLSPTAMSNVSAISMDTISTMFSEFAASQKLQFDEYSRRQDNKLESIVKMTLETAQLQIDGIRKEHSEKDKIMEQLVQTSQMQVQKLTTIMEHQQAESSQTVQRLTSMMEKQNDDSTKLMQFFQATMAHNPLSTPPTAKLNLGSPSPPAVPLQDTSPFRPSVSLSLPSKPVVNPYRTRQPPPTIKGKVAKHTDEAIMENHTFVGYPTSPTRLAAELSYTQQQVTTLPIRSGKILQTPPRSSKRDPLASPSTVNSATSTTSATPPSTVSDNSSALTPVSVNPATLSTPSTQSVNPSTNESSQIQEVTQSQRARAGPRKDE